MTVLTSELTMDQVGASAWLFDLDLSPYLTQGPGDPTYVEVFIEDSSSYVTELESSERQSREDAFSGVSVRQVSPDGMRFGFAPITPEHQAPGAVRRAFDDCHHRPDRVASVTPTAFTWDIDRNACAAATAMLHDAARTSNPAVTSVSSWIRAERQVVRIACSDGRVASDVRERWHLGLHVRTADLRGTASAAEFVGARTQPELVRMITPRLANDVTRRSMRKLGREAIKPGEMTVIFEPVASGPITHEVCGHLCEADAILAGSVLSNRLGEQLADAVVNVVDDGAAPGAWGTARVDDEGYATGVTSLIKDGVLVGYLTDRVTAELMGARRSGNARRQSYAQLPKPRMTNTVLRPSDGGDLELENLTDGLLVHRIDAARVNANTGSFELGVPEASVIRGGVVAEAVGGFTIVGNALQLLSGIEAVGSAGEMSVGTCRKSGQRLPVGTGEAAIRVRRMTVQV